MYVELFIGDWRDKNINKTLEEIQPRLLQTLPNSRFSLIFLFESFGRKNGGGRWPVGSEHGVVMSRQDENP